MIHEKDHTLDFIPKINSKAELSYNAKSSPFFRKKCFLICNSCFWCASYFIIEDNNNDNKNNDAIISKCPICDKGKVESMPIANDELYKFDYDLKRGVTLEFSRENEEVLN